MRPLVARSACAAVVTAGLIAAAIPGLASPVAPDLTGGGPWFNTGGRPLSIASLRGRVAAVEMWTAGCINCLDTLPYVKQWYAKYHGRGFTVVGVHTPEFAHEGRVEYVRAALARLGIAYPVVMDNDHRIWNAYHNLYWPALYLIDKRGRIRYTHVGEGDYDTTERQIVDLINEKI